MSLHVYEIGPDLIVARSDDEAWRVWSDTTGESDEMYRHDLVQLPDDRELTISERPDGSIAEFQEPGARPVKRTCAEWATREGVCFLASSEC